MDGEVRFEDQGEEFGAPPVRSAGFDLSGKLVTWGLVGSRKEAQSVLLVIAVLSSIAAIYFFLSTVGGSPPPPPPIG